MNIQSKKREKYQYRGCYHQKQVSYKYPINVSAYQYNNSNQTPEISTPHLSYRGVTYNSPKQNFVVKFGLSAYIQKYRGVEYLTCLTSLNSDEKHN